MFFILSKIFSFALQPFFWIVLAFYLAYFLKNEKWKKRSFKLGLIMILFFSNTVILSEFMRGWEVSGEKIENVNHNDIAVVLGGMTEFNNDLNRLSIRRGGDRIWQAIQLYKANKVDKILISGSHGHLIDKGLREAVQLKEVLINMGIPTGDILVETQSKNTHENAVETRKIIGENQSIILVTSALHMKRSIACFKKAGFRDFDVFSTDHYTGEKRGYFIEQYFIPSSSTLAEWNLLLKEWVGTMVYWMVGYI